MKLWAPIRTAVLFMLFYTVFTGLLYPGLITLFSKLLFPEKAEGSLIFENQKLIGSELIGQAFDEPRYFWGRPSATTPYPYNAIASNASNLGPANPALITVIQDRISKLHAVDPSNQLPIPIELVQASGSGLDPEISPEAAKYQVGRIAGIRQMPEDELIKLIEAFTEDPQFGFLGHTRVNVLKLNLALDKKSQERQSKNGKNGKVRSDKPVRTSK